MRFDEWLLSSDFLRPYLEIRELDLEKIYLIGKVI
jgi:hypothetical protein